MISLDDFLLYLKARWRMKKAESKGYSSWTDVMSELGLKDSDLDDIDVEIEQ